MPVTGSKSSSMLQFELLDETLDINNTQFYNLSIQATLDGFLFAILDTESSKYLGIKRYQFERTINPDKQFDEISRIIQDACPSLKQLWLSTNGLGSHRVEKRILEIFDILDLKKLEALHVNISIDGIGEVHDKIRGIKGAFKQSIKTIETLQRITKQYPLKISMGTVIQPLNLHQIDEIEKFADNVGIPINFAPLMFDFYFNNFSNPNLMFNKKDLEEFKEIIDRKLSNGCSTINFYWHDYRCMLDGAKRKSPCAFARYVLSLYPTGDILPCSREDWIVFGNVNDEPVDKIWFGDKAKEIRRKMRKEVCPRCPSYCGVEFSLQKEFFTYAKYYLKKKFATDRNTGEDV